MSGLAGQAALLVSGVVSARLLGVEDRGHLALLAFFPGLLVQIGTLGLPVAATYYIARAPSHSRALAVMLWRVGVVQCAVLLALHVGVLAAVLGASGSDVLTASAISLVALPAFLGHTYGLAVLQGTGHFKAFNLYRLLPVALNAVLVLGAAAYGAAGLEVFVALWAGSLLVAGLLTSVTAVRALPSVGDGEPPPLNQMVKFGLKGFLGSASPLETFRLDMAVIGLFLSPTSLGLYVAGMAFTNLPRFMAQSVGMVAYPTVAGRSGPDGRRLMWRFTLLVSTVSAALVGALELTAGALVPALFGDAFQDAVPITRILLLSALFLSMRRILSDAARGAGQPEAGTIAEVVSWVALLPALAVLAPLLGVRGVAWALVISSAVSAVILFVVVVLSGRRAVARETTISVIPAPPELPL